MKKSSELLQNQKYEHFDIFQQGPYNILQQTLTQVSSFVTIVESSMHIVYLPLLHGWSISINVILNAYAHPNN